MCNIPIGKRGRILAGRHTGWDIVVLPDGVNSDSYLILYINPNANEGFDDWAIDLDMVRSYLEDIDVDWLFFEGTPQANYYASWLDPTAPK